MTYRYIAITAKIAPLATVLKDSHQKSVVAEARLAEAAPDLLTACRYAEGMLARVSDAALSDADRKACIEAIQRVVRAAIDDAIDTEVQS